MNKVILGAVALALMGGGAWFFYSKNQPSAEVVTKGETEGKKSDASSATEEKKEAQASDDKRETPKQDSQADASKDAEESADQKVVLAEVSNGVKVTLADFNAVKDNLPIAVKKASEDERVYKKILSGLIDNKLLLKYAQDSGADKNPEIQKNMPELEERLLLKIFLEKEAAKIITDDELKKQYKKVLDMMPKDQMEIQICNIFVQTKADAEEIIKQINGGKSFDSLLEKSLDPEGKKKGGLFGYVTKDRMPKEFAEKAFATKVGSVVSVPMQFGKSAYSVVLVKDKRKVEPPKFEEIKEELIKAVSPEYAAKVVDKIRAESKVEKFDLEGKPLPEKTTEQLKNEIAEKEKKGVQPLDMSKVSDTAVVAKFKDGKTITVGDLKKALSQLPPELSQFPFSLIFEIVLNLEVDKVILKQAADAAGIRNSVEFKRIYQEGKNILAQKAYVDKIAKEKVTETEIQDKYKQLIAMLPPNDRQAKLRHILVQTKEKAQELLNKINKGASFDELLKTESIDEKSKQNNGEIGTVQKSELPKEVAEPIFKLKGAVVVKEVLKLFDQGYSVVKVESFSDVAKPTIEQVREELKKRLAAGIVAKQLTELKKSVTVKMFSLDGKELANETAPAVTAAESAAPNAEEKK